MEPPQEDNNLNTSLEADEVSNTAASSGSSSPVNEPIDKSSTTSNEKGIKQVLGIRLRGLLSKINVYLVLFFLLLLIALSIIVISTRRSKQESIINEDLTLSAEEIDNIKNSEAKVGDPKQTLTIESNAIFSGKVLVRDSLDVAGTIKVGGSLTLPGITVSGTSAFDQINANNLSITGNTSVQGVLNIQKTLTVSGNATFGGNISAPQITVDSIKINKDLTFSRHIDTGGSTPAKSDGNALGSGGTSSVSGTDTAGTLKISTGNSPGAGCFATITFANSFNETPHIVVTPVGSSASSIDYYINRTSSNFSICTSNSAPPNVSFYFDWIAIE